MKRPGTILVLDDDPGTCESLADVLSARGYAVEAAHRGAEGLARMASRPFDAAIVDIRLPDVSGLDLLAAVKARSPETEIIFITGHASVNTAIQALNGEAFGYLVKPFEVDHLLATIGKALDKQALSRALREAEELHRLITGSITDALFLVSAAGRLLFANRQAEALTGYALHELREQPVMELLQAGRPRRRLDAGEPVPDPLETRLVRKDGREIWLEVSLSAVGPGGQAAGYLAVARDVTQRKRAEAAAAALADVGRLVSRSLDLEEVGRHVADSLRRLLGATSAAVFRVEPGSADLVALATAGDMASASEHGIVVPHGAGVVGLAVRERQPVLTADILADPRITLDEPLRARIAALSYRAALAVPLTIQDRVIGVLAATGQLGRAFDAEDVRTAQALADQAAVALDNARLYQEAERRRREADELARESRQAYEELARTQDQLVQAQKMEAVGRLAGGVAHDFNNLLTIILGRTQMLLLQLPADSPFRRHIQLVEQTGHRAAALTEQLLTFGRKQARAPRVLDLGQTVEGMHRMLRRLLGEDVDLVTAAASPLGAVRADPTQVEQVILNLAINARDAMPRGGRLTIETRDIELDESYARLRPGVPPGAYVMLAVSDTGTGMDAETRARVFEPFFTTKGPGKGTGLGLATVYAIVKQAGGSIFLYSEPGAGTTFKVYFPRVDERAAPAAPIERPAAIPRGSETVLLVEDEESVRDLAREILEAQGYRVLEAADPGEALVLAERTAEPIHLVLTDVVMPGMSGRALADRLAEVRPGLRVLYMSGYTDDAIVRHGVLEAGSAFIQKPFTPEGLARRAREVLDAGRPDAPAVAS